MPPFLKGPALKEKNLLLTEQILSLKSGPRLKSCVLQEIRQEYMFFPFLMENMKVNVTLFQEKRHRAFIRAGAFVRIRTVFLIRKKLVIKVI